jgi:hypothetical protein
MQEIEQYLYNSLKDSCPSMHITRLNAVLDVAAGLRTSQNLSLSELGRNLPGNTQLKNKIKKVDRLEGNTILHTELFSLYQGLSHFVFKYISHAASVPLIVDICCLKDDREIQMLSAEIALKGRSIPLYREVYRDTETKGRAKNFLKELSLCIPRNRHVIIIMDAGFYDEWFKEIETLGWYWLCRIRGTKSVKLSEQLEWKTVQELIPDIKAKTTHYEQALLTKDHKRPCRMVTTNRQPKGRKVKTSRGKTTSTVSNGSYSQANKEPWILATNLPSEYKPVDVVNLYFKRMQIEESFRDVKSHQFGLSGRYVRTSSVDRWGVKMLLAAIVQITYWVIGVIAHSQNKQKYFQANTVKDKKIFSYFTLGKLMIEHNQLSSLAPDSRALQDIIEQELNRVW